MDIMSLFLHLFNVSVSASILALAVVLFRLIFKKAPKWLTVFLWALVAARLIFPFSIESALSLIPSREVVPSEILTIDPNKVHDTVYGLIENPAYYEYFNSTVAVESVNRFQRDVMVYSIVWLIGVAAMLLYATVSYAKLRYTVRVSVPYRENVWLCDNVKSPFILGVFRPKIYLPSDVDKETSELVLRHEKAHLKRKDHLWKPFGFVLLSVYWFNPVLWISYILLCRDIEFACDERVIKDMENADKKAYSEALLSCSVPQKMISACPVAFGEVGVKKRIKSVLNYKKPAFWIIIIAVVVSVVLAVCFMTDPKEVNGGYKTFNGIEEISELSFPMKNIILDSHTYTVKKGENDYFEAKYEDGFNFSDINSFLASLELGLMVDGMENPLHELQFDAIIEIESNRYDNLSVYFYNGYNKLYMQMGNSNYSVRSRDYVIFNSEEVKEYFETESYKRHAVWEFDPASSAWGHAELYLYVDEKFEISGEVRGEGVIQSVTNEERGLKGITWRPDITKEQKEYNIIIPVTYEGKSSAFNITLIETGKKNFRTYYNVRSENTVLSSWGSGYEFVLGFPENKENDTDSVTFYDLEADGFDMQLIVDLLKTNKAVIRNGQNEAEVYKCDNIIAALEGLWWEYEKGYHSHPSAEELERMKSYSIEVADGKNKTYCINFDKSGSQMWFSDNTGAYSPTFKVKNSSDVTVRSFFGNEEFFNYSFVWDYNSTANTYSYGHLNLIVDGEYESYTATCESGSLTTATISDDRVHGIVQSDPVKKITCTKDDNLIWMPDLSAPETIFFELKLADGETTDFFVYINQIGTNYSGSTLYEITAEYANITMEENGVVHFEQTYEKWWYYNPYAGATWFYITEYLLPEGYEIKSAETTSGTATIENIYYNEPDKGKCINWTPGVNTDKAEIVITALKNGKEVQFRIYVSLSDENTEEGTKWYNISPINCKMRGKGVSTYLLEEK